jgi:SET domain-containing protein
MTPLLYIKKVKGKGRGVFSRTAIAKDSIIEECPLLVMPGDEYALLVSTRVADYCFFFDREKEELAIVLGFGSVYNHAIQSNACHQLDHGNRIMNIYAVNDIPAGQEICINYNGEPGNEGLQWFIDRGIAYKP